MDEYKYTVNQLAERVCQLLEENNANMRKIIKLKKENAKLKHLLSAERMVNKFIVELPEIPTETVIQDDVRKEWFNNGIKFWG